MPSRPAAVIHSIAATQHGYFSAAQASAAGVADAALAAMVRSGTVQRVSRGVYRVTQYPQDRFGQYMEAVLWPQRGAHGVLSHESALEFHNLSDANPAQVHITVAPTHRVRRATPGHLRVHLAELGAGDVQVLDGVPVTTPVRTIADCRKSHLSPELIRQAIDDGRRNGKLTHREADALAAELG